jgi:two-component system NtrC family response regulator
MKTMRILIVEDDPVTQEILSRALSPDYEVDVVSSGEEALKLIERRLPSIVLLDIILPGIDGMETLARIKKSHPDLTVIVITSVGEVKTAVDAMKMGAYDYMNKPIHLDHLKTTLSRSVETLRLRTTVANIHSYNIERFNKRRFVSVSKTMQRVFKLVEQIGRTPDTTVLIQGETGTGKELIAEAIHFKSSRVNGQFVAVNSGALPQNLVESELFGYEKGSFTGSLNRDKKGKFEIADGGTLFLDEISELPLEAQTKLLRVLEEKEFYRVGGTQKIKVDVRIVTASNRHIEEAVRSGQFREDLYYRLNIARINIPPLRERKEDIIPIAQLFMENYNQKFGNHFRGISEKAEEILLSHPWRGNVRELRNVIERVFLAEGGDIVEPRHLSFLDSQLSISPKTASDSFPGELPDQGVELEGVIKDLVCQALEKCRGNKAKTARLLGITKPTLLYRLKKFDLEA